MTSYQILGKGFKRNKAKEKRVSVKFIYNERQYNHILPKSVVIDDKEVTLEEVGFDKFAAVFIEREALPRLDSIIEKLENETPEERSARLLENDRRRQEAKKAYAKLPESEKEKMHLSSLTGTVNSFIENGVISKDNVQFQNLKNYLDVKK